MSGAATGVALASAGACGAHGLAGVVSPLMLPHVRTSLQHLQQELHATVARCQHVHSLFRAVCARFAEDALAAAAAAPAAPSPAAATPRTMPTVAGETDATADAAATADSPAPTDPDIANAVFAADAAAASAPVNAARLPHLSSVLATARGFLRYCPRYCAAPCVRCADC